MSISATASETWESVKTQGFSGRIGGDLVNFLAVASAGLSLWGFLVNDQDNTLGFWLTIAAIIVGIVAVIMLFWTAGALIRRWNAHDIDLERLPAFLNLAGGLAALLSAGLTIISLADSNSALARTLSFGGLDWFIFSGIAIWGLAEVVNVILGLRKLRRLQPGHPELYKKRWVKGAVALSILKGIVLIPVTLILLFIYLLPEVRISVGYIVGALVAFTVITVIGVLVGFWKWSIRRSLRARQATLQREYEEMQQQAKERQKADAIQILRASKDWMKTMVAMMVLENNGWIKEALKGGDFRGAKLATINLHEADLTNTNLSRADLNLSNLANANLENANLTDAELVGVNLSHANLKGTNLTNADMRGARVDRVKFDRNTTIMPDGEPAGSSPHFSPFTRRRRRAKQR